MICAFHADGCPIGLGAGAELGSSFRHLIQTAVVAAARRRELEVDDLAGRVDVVFGHEMEAAHFVGHRERRNEQLRGRWRIVRLIAAPGSRAHARAAPVPIPDLFHHALDPGPLPAEPIWPVLPPVPVCAAVESGFGASSLSSGGAGVTSGTFIATC